ncbi:Crp/Fnr family transcriptional regulator [Sinomicrobium weinanense]|uniref:Crp/Fnr family transcriptional regulator n=1 Tax=Sinomicrobium weinanense TaxID=2842200 RepID=A0A926JSZ4_9FLAO|nr:Crp/Fnr family transcriptional regulator [Sinomicrobium weinanense]MBC9796692.1 Crp/Fnr family transcriptional regulator [Sinomicrobium weinanense]MBU3123033.1 Crp/Fnr family transcriptional regulator [Sinomicrobium weinanense]
MEKEKYRAAFRSAFESYVPITDESWSSINSITHFQTLQKGEVLLREGQVARSLYFICKGALRTYFTDADGNVYNKNLFMEGSYAASKVSLLQGAPSYFTIEALEDSILITINYKGYRELIRTNEDIRNFYIAYIEKNWIIEKEQREISLVMENATDRYLKLLEKHPDIDRRIPKLHIASHLGITPTQLSRIRKNLKIKNENKPA